MTNRRRKCRLADSTHRNIDLRDFKELIIATVDATVPGKNPEVNKDYFSTDLLSQSEAVSLGRALSKLQELNVYGKQVTLFRLFEGKVCDVDDTDSVVAKTKGGHL